MLKNSQVAMAMLVSMKERVLLTYYKSLHMAKKEITLEKQGLASEVWEDLVDFAMFAKGDIGILLEAGLEVVIDNAIDEYMDKGWASND